jgi:type II secretory pathway component GspD/PulD (secretin)
MKMKSGINCLNIFLIACLGTLPGMAQHPEVVDSDLLDMIEAVGQNETEPEVTVLDYSDPLDRVMATVSAADERAEEVDEVVADVITSEEPQEQEAEVDNLDMGSYDEEVATASGNLISVRLNKVGLEEAINLFAQLSGANIIVPELTEAAQISVNLKDVEWRPALQSILDSYNYELYQRVSGSNVYSVRRRPAGAPEPQVVETFLLKYATVPNAAELIRGLLPEDAKVSEFASRNMIVVKSSESSLSEIRSVLETIDKVRQQVFIESKFMELDDQAKKDLGIDWSVLTAYSAGTVGPTTRNYGKSDSKSDTTSRFKDANGLSYEQTAGYVDNGQRIPGSGIFQLEGVTPTGEDIRTKATTDILTSVLSADEFRLALSALENNEGVNVVSNPKIIVANEERANISIIEREPNLKQSRQQALNDTPDTVVFELDPDRPFFDYGIKLDVTPSINTSSNITVSINPSLTRFVRAKAAGDNTYPVIDEKSIETVFSLASGQTAAIGGLTQVKESEVERKVPLLGSIPLLGRLFSWEQTLRDQSETIIFVTVGLANTQNIDEEIGMPQDAELARREVIKNRNMRILRDKGRLYFEAEENERLDDMMKTMDRKEEERKARRERKLQKELEKAAKRTSENNEIAAVN